MSIEFVFSELEGGATIIDNPELYKKARELADQKYKKPSAYKSSFIVKKYKELGGTYTGPKPKTSGLARWHDEEWMDIAGKDYPVFRPTRRVNKDTPLTPAEIDEDNLKYQIALKQKIKGNANLPPFKQAGKISTGDLKGLLNASYHSKKPKDYKDYEIDPELSGQRVQVYKKKGTNEAFVVHRGTSGVHDWGNDLKALAGYDISKSKRIKHASAVQKKAEAKYGAENVSTLGHSLGSNIASQVGQNSKEIINLNKYVPPQDRNKPISDKEYNIRTYRDPASVLTPNDPNLITIPSRSFNPLTEHSTDVLDRLPEDTMIGRGHLKKLSKKQLKDLIKRLPKTASKYKTTGKKKEELVDYCCERCALE